MAALAIRKERLNILPTVGHLGHKSANMGKTLKAVKVTTGMLRHTWLCKTLTCIVFCVAADWVKAGQSHQTSAVHIPFPFSYIPTVGACLPSSAKYTFQDATSS